MTPERRKVGVRRDLNNLVRDEKGDLSPVKIGLLVGQWLSVKLILENGQAIIANWDSLTVLFAVLIAPDLFKKLVNMKYGNGGAVTTTVTDTATTSKSRSVARKPPTDEGPPQ